MQRVSFDYSGCAVLVTGGTSGIGLGIARAFAAGGASVLGIGSLTSFFGLEAVPGYATAKGALVQLTRTLAVSWARDNIRCNLIAACNIRTPMNEGMTPAMFDNLYARLPIRRQGEVEDIAGAALYLASPLAAYVTGQTLAVDGGYTIAMYM